MTETDRLLDHLIEECAEVIQRVTKAKHFGLYEIQPGQELNNMQRIIYELNDVAAVADLLDPAWMDDTMIDAKKVKVEHYTNYSRELGVVE